MRIFYAIMWKGENGTGSTSWWTERRGNLGPVRRAGIFTKKELAERYNDLGAARDYMQIVEIKMYDTGRCLFTPIDAEEVLS